MIDHDAKADFKRFLAKKPKIIDFFFAQIFHLAIRFCHNFAKIIQKTDNSDHLLMLFKF